MLGGSFGDEASMGWPMEDGGLDISDRMDVSLTSIELLVLESNKLEAKFGMPQLQQIQGSDEFARAWYTKVFMFKHFVWCHVSHLSQHTAS